MCYGLLSLISPVTLFLRVTLNVPHARCDCWWRRAGDEVTHTYDADLERNDFSLINHSFLQHLDPPRLCALDLPGGHLNGGLGAPDANFLPRFPDELEVCPRPGSIRVEVLHPRP